MPTPTPTPPPACSYDTTIADGSKPYGSPPSQPGVCLPTDAQVAAAGRPYAVWATITVTRANEGEVLFGLTCTDVSGSTGYGLEVKRSPKGTSIGWTPVAGRSQAGTTVTSNGYAMRQVGPAYLPGGATCKLFGGWSTTQSWGARLFVTFDMDGDGHEPSDTVYTGSPPAT